MRFHRLLIVTLFVSVTILPSARLMAASAQQQSGEIAYGDQVTGRVSEGRGGVWTFDGEAGDEIRIEMTSSAIDTFLELLDDDRMLLTFDDDGGGGTDSLITGYVLPVSGRYTIVASGFDGASGLYTLSLDLTASGIEVGTAGSSMVYGEVVQARVTTPDGDRWTFEGQAGDQISVAMQSSTMDAYLELLDTSGNLLVWDDDSGGGTDSLITEFVLETPGTYTIVAGGFDGDTGPYTLELDLTDSDLPVGSQDGEIAYGQTQSGRVTSDNGDRWTFQGSAGDVVTIEMTSLSLDTYLELEGPSGELLTEDDDGGGGTDSLIDNYYLAEAGTYTIVARGYSESRGPYDLTLSSMRTGDGPIDNSLLIGITIGAVLCAMLVTVLAAVVVIVVTRRPAPENEKRR